MKQTLFLFTIIVVLISCEKIDTIETAKQYSIEDIHNSPDFYWYKTEYDAYNFNPIIIDSIINMFADGFKVIIYTSPSCFCGSSYTKFPQLMKVLEQCHLTQTENHYEIYVVTDNGEELHFKHPYSNIFQVKETPAFFLLKDNGLHYSLMEQVNGQKVSIEQALLDGLKFLIMNNED